MHITVDRKELVSALEASTRARAKNSSINALRNVLVQVENGYLTVAGTNLTTTAIAKIPRVILDAHSPHQAVIDPEKILRLMKKSKVERIEIDIQEEKVAIHIGETRLELPSLPPGEFPALPVKKTGKLTASYEFDTSTLREAMMDVMPCVSDDETRPYLNGLCFQFDGTEATLVSTDGHRMAIRCLMDIRPQGCVESEIECLVPLSGVKEILANVKGKKVSGKARMEIFSLKDHRKVRVSLKHEGVEKEIWVKIPDAEFPPWQNIVPRPNGIHIQMDAEELAEVAREAKTFCTDRHRAVHFIPNGISVDVAVENPETGTYSREVSAEITGKVPEKVGLNVTYVQDALKSIGGETVTLHLGESPIDSTLWTSDREECRVVIMPVSL